MITTIPRKGTSVAGLLDYLGSPKREGAELLVTNLAGDSLEDWARQIEGLSRCHFPRRNHLSKHLILSFAPGEQLERDTLEEITRVYLEGMGYQDSPYVVFLHRDREHWHLHIATTPTTWQGEPVRENWDWPRSERVARKIEERFGLVRVPLSETAALRAPSLGEVRERKKTGEPSARERFQQDIHRAGVASKSLADFLARLRLAGYQVRLLVDRQRRIRGISFAKGEFAFKGSQLGKAYQGARFLETFGLSYDPERDSGTIASRAVERPDLGEPRPARRVALQESAPSEKPRSSRAAEPAARSLPLPEGSYHVAAFNPRIDSEQHFGRRPEGARAWFHFGLSAAEVARSREAWQEATPGHDLWIRFTQHGTAIAFQGISRQALDRLRAAGFEPSWTVAMGERFDVLYRIEKLGETDRSEAAGLLRERFGLPPGLNVWSDGVRLPGARVVSLPEAPRAELVASRPGTLPLAALLREGRARRQQARELEVLTQKLAARLPQEPEPAQPRGGGPRLAVKTDVEILRGAYRTESLNRALSAHGGSREALRRGFETAELYAAEIEYRAWEALEAHRAARARAQEAASQLGAAYALAGRERSDQALLAYQS
nr:relaxase/mobilization nuclease domain-containing protein [Thermoanaerobaculia bacterium]